MANLYNITDYRITPRENPGWFSEAIFGGDVFEKGKITPLEDVKGNTDLNLFNLVGDLLQLDGIDCAWTPKEIAKLSQKQLSVITYKINAEQCISALEKSNLLWSLGRGARFQSLPTDLQELTLFKTKVQLSEEVETLIFTGDSSNVDEFDGVAPTLVKSADSLQLKGVVHTKANILDEIEKTYLAAPKTVVAQGKRDKTLNIYLSYEDMELVEIALANIYNENVVVRPSFTKSGEVIKYMGVDIVPCLGLEDTIIIANSTNLVVGTDLISDTQELEFGQFPKPYDDKVFLKGRLRLGFAVLFENECVINSTAIAADRL